MSVDKLAQLAIEAADVAQAGNNPEGYVWRPYIRALKRARP